MSVCSQPGPAVTVTVPPYSGPGAPYRVEQMCRDGGAYVKIRWNAAPNAEYYRVYWEGLFYSTIYHKTEIWLGPVYTTATYVDVSVYIEACNKSGQCI